MRTPRLEFWFDFVSPYAYVAALRLDDLAQRVGAAVRWQPFFLGPMSRSQDWRHSPLNIPPVKERYMWRDVERQCLKHGIAFLKPSIFPQNSLLAVRVATLALHERWLPDYARAVFAANFSAAQNIADPAVIAAILDRLGQNAPLWLDRAQDQEARVALFRQTERAESLGVFGAPTFIACGELFWGNDRLEDACAWHSAHA